MDKSITLLKTTFKSIHQKSIESNNERLRTSSEENITPGSRAVNGGDDGAHQIAPYVYVCVF